MVYHRGLEFTRCPSGIFGRRNGTSWLGVLALVGRIAKAKLMCGRALGMASTMEEDLKVFDQPGRDAD